MIRALSLNQFQLTSKLFNAIVEVDVCNRGTGKTTNFAIKSDAVAHTMPRGKSAFVNRTYKNALDLTLPGVIDGWKKLGYIECETDREPGHFIIGKRPPKNWPKPFTAPLSYENCISWYTGHLHYIVSQDRKFSFRGPNIDFLFADEGLTLKKDQFEEEVMGAMRGNRQVFKNVHLHQGIHIASSKPYGTEGRWLLDYGNYYIINGDDFEIVRNKIADVALEIIDTQDADVRKELWREYVNLKRQVKIYPDKDGYLYLESFPFDNLENVGLGYFQRNRKTMSLFKFKVEMLNWTPRKIDAGFYPDLDIGKHTYDAVNYSHLEIVGYSHSNKPKQDCRFDSDIDSKDALHVALDYGGSHNCMWVNQPRVGETRWLNYFFELHPKRTKDVVQQFCDYYKHHLRKHVHYYYDHTAIGKDGKSDGTYNEIVIRCFRENGWTINPIYMGKAPAQFKKYELAGKALREDEGMPKQRFNRSNCRQGLMSMELAATKQGRDGVEKDKTLEADKEYPQQDATHGSDAFDQLLWGQLSAFNRNKEFFDVMYR